MNEMGQSVHSLGSVVAQHRELRDRVRKLCQLVCDPYAEPGLSDAFAKVKNQLGELRDFLEYHLAQEALGGYLEDAVARLPRLGKVADEIEREHPELLGEIDTLIERTKTAKPSLDEWQEFGEAVTAFGRKLMEHEAAENRILQQGFNEDPALFE